MSLNSQPEEPVHYQSESANRICALIKTNAERFCVMTINSQSEKPIHFQSELADQNCAQIKTNAERFSMSQSLSKWINWKE